VTAAGLAPSRAGVRPVVTAIGRRAHAALAASGGRARRTIALSTSLYAEAGGDLIWIGPCGTPLHPRAVIVTALPVAAGVVHVDIDGLAPWHPPPLGVDPACLGAGARLLGATLRDLGEPRGLGRLLLAGDGDDAVTARARPHARSLALACAAGDVDAVVEAARPLLGLGEGLTPSGDDLVGGALFARALLGPADSAWAAAAARIVAEAATRTHPLSARLLADLAAGEGWAPLHELAAALAASDRAAAVRAARRLAALGHSSGWDIQAGLMSGLGHIPRA
jgi:hypothetical protein